MIVNTKYKLEMIKVEGGVFKMGGNENTREQPIHTVKLSTFCIGKYPVTQKLWREVMGDNPSHFKGENLPVETVSWNDVQKFITKLNGLTKEKYRLPTEAEWEFAARGGNQSKNYPYSGSNTIDEVAWCSSNSGKKTHPVGTKKPNELGIYDMSGNVWEWCSDWYGTYQSLDQTNPKGKSRGTYRVYRGGSWYYYASGCSTTYRFRYHPAYLNADLGFRLACDFCI